MRQPLSVTSGRRHCAALSGDGHASAVKAARRPVVLPYRRCMPAGKRPTLEDTVTARRTLLDGLAHDINIVELVSELVPLHPRDNTFPGEVFLRLAADALDWCEASRADPLSLEGLRERFLPECAFRAGRTRSSSTRCWLRQLFMAGPTRTCWMRSPGGRATISGNTPCSRPSPTSAPRPAGRTCLYTRHARTWLSAPTTRHHSGLFGTPLGTFIGQRSSRLERRFASRCVTAAWWQ